MKQGEESKLFWLKGCSMDQSDTQTPHGDELKIWQKNYSVILSSHYEEIRKVLQNLVHI